MRWRGDGVGRGAAAATLPVFHHVVIAETWAAARGLVALGGYRQGTYGFLRGRKITQLGILLRSCSAAWELRWIFRPRRCGCRAWGCWERGCLGARRCGRGPGLLWQPAPLPIACRQRGTARRRAASSRGRQKTTVAVLAMACLPVLRRRSDELASLIPGRGCLGPRLRCHYFMHRQELAAGLASTLAR